VKNRPLGTQAAPVCEGGVLAPVRLMTADCLRWRSIDRIAAIGRTAVAVNDFRIARLTTRARSNTRRECSSVHPHSARLMCTVRVVVGPTRPDL